MVARQHSGRRENPRGWSQDDEAEIPATEKLPTPQLQSSSCKQNCSSGAGSELLMNELASHFTTLGDAGKLHHLRLFGH